MTIKTWFQEKNLTANQRYLLATGELTVEKETEKAYNLKCTADEGTFTFWCPKSCTEAGEARKATAEELKKAQASTRTIVGNDGKVYKMI